MDGVPVDLRAMEYDLLAFFALHPHQLFSRSELLVLVWRSDSAWQRESTVTEHIYRVRAKINRPGERNTIVTIRGGGYRYDPCTVAPVLDEFSCARGEYVVVATLRALLRIGSAEDAAALLHRSVQQLGGTVVAAQDASADALSIDLTLGVCAPMLAVAEPGSVARVLLERFLPALADDARSAVNLLRRTVQADRGSSPLLRSKSRRGVRDEEAVDCSEQSGGIERLGQILRAEGEAGSNVLRSHSPAEEHRWKIRPNLLTKAGEELEAVQIRNAHVQDHEIG